MDSYVNAFTPQVDMNLVHSEFVHVDDVPDRFHERMIDNLYIINVTVKPSMEPIVFTSSAKAEAFYFNNIPILMSADLVLNRCSYDKYHCVGAEGPEQQLDSQLAMLNAAENFLRQSQKPTKVIVIEGARGTGKSYVARQIFAQLASDEKFKINFKRHRFLNEVYAEILF